MESLCVFSQVASAVLCSVNALYVLGFASHLQPTSLGRTRERDFVVVGVLKSRYMVGLLRGEQRVSGMISCSDRAGERAPQIYTCMV